MARPLRRTSSPPRHGKPCLPATRPASAPRSGCGLALERRHRQDAVETSSTSSRVTCHRTGLLGVACRRSRNRQHLRDGRRRDGGRAEQGRKLLWDRSIEWKSFAAFTTHGGPHRVADRRRQPRHRQCRDLELGHRGVAPASLRRDGTSARATHLGRDPWRRPYDTKLLRAVIATINGRACYQRQRGRRRSTR